MGAAEDFIDAVKTGNAPRVGELLAAQPALASTRDANGVSAVLLSVFYGRKDVKDLLLAVKPRLDLFEAATTGDVEAVRSMVTSPDSDRSALEATTSQGFTPLGLAAFFGHRAVVEVLLDSGAQIEAVDKSFNANTAMDAAVAGNHTETALLLLSRGASVKVRDSAQYTPLHKAAHHGNRTLVEALLAGGADVGAVNSQGKTPLDLAMAAGRTDVLPLLT